MNRQLGQVVRQHAETHSSLYLFTAVLFSVGVVFGSLTIQSLGTSQQNELFYYFQQFLVEMQKDHFVASGFAFTQNFMHYFKFIGFIWILGLSIIGLPIILVMIFLKGVFIGFTVGFLVHQKGWAGAVLASVGVIPQNLIIVPLMLVVGVFSISFSFKLIGHLMGTKQPYQKLSLGRYISLLLLALLFLLLISVFETFISPLMMNGLIKS